MTRLVLLGCDPGATGAIAALRVDDGALVWVQDMPAHGKIVSGSLIASLLDDQDVERAYVEQVGAMPKQGVASTCGFGRSYGTLLGTLGALGVPFEMVAPTVWQRAERVTGRSARDKTLSRQRASELFPTFAASFARARDHGRADAALIAHWGLMHGQHADGRRDVLRAVPDAGNGSLAREPSGGT